MDRAATTDMGIAHDVTLAAGQALSSIRAGDKKFAGYRVAAGEAAGIQVTSIAMKDHVLGWGEFIGTYEHGSDPR